MEKVKKVIIVDDFALSRAILKKMIAFRSDFVVCGEFENAEDCIEYLKNNDADLVIMDFCLPKMNGTNASTHWRPEPQMVWDTAIIPKQP